MILRFLLAYAAANECIEQQVAQHSHNKPVALDGANLVCKQVLNERHYTTTDNHGHEKTAGRSCVLAKSLGSQVEDNSPHHTGAKTTEDDEHDLGGNDCVNIKETNLEIHCLRLGHEDSHEQKGDGNHGGYGELCT